MESVDTFVGDSTESETDSRVINDVKHRNQNPQMSNRSSAQTTFINHERKRSISSNLDNLSNSENFVSRSSISSNEDGPNNPRRPNKQEVHFVQTGILFLFVNPSRYQCFIILILAGSRSRVVNVS